MGSHKKKVIQGFSGGARLKPALLAGLLIAALCSCRTVVHKAYCDCADRSQYKPLPEGSNYLVLVLETGDSVCSSALKSEVKVDFSKKVNGTLKSYYYNDNLRDIVPIKNGKKNGESYTYFSNGKLLLKAHYMQGKLYGEAIEYDRNGRIREVRHYYESRPVGKWIIYDSVGVVVKEIVH